MLPLIMPVRALQQRTSTPKARRSGLARDKWTSTRFGELASVTHGWPFKSELFSEELTGKPIIVSIGNFRYTGGFRFETTTTKEYRGEYPKGYELKPGDTLLVMTCQTAGGEILGIPARVPDDGRIYLHNQRMGKIVIKDEKRFDADFAYWLCLWQKFNHHLATSASGTKILHTSPGRIEDFQFDLPPLPTQRAIAGVLGALVACERAMAFPAPPLIACPACAPAACAASIAAWSWPACPCGGFTALSRTGGTIALYPISPTALASVSGPVAAESYFTVATLVAKFTLADSTPGCLLSRFSIRFAHEAQVIPSIGRSARSMGFVAVGDASPLCWCPWAFVIVVLRIPCKSQGVAADVVRSAGELNTDFSVLPFLSTAAAMSAPTTTAPTIKGTNFRQPVAGGLS